MGIGASVGVQVATKKPGFSTGSKRLTSSSDWKASVFCNSESKNPVSKRGLNGYEQVILVKDRN